MTGTNSKSDRTETRLLRGGGKKIYIVQEGKRESLRDGIFEIVKEIVSVERDGGWEAEGWGTL